MERCLVISKGTELLRVPARRLIYVSADGNYANVVTQDNHSKMVSYQLGQLEDMMVSAPNERSKTKIRELIAEMQKV